MPLVRSISGLRGTLGDALTPDLVARYASAFAAYVGGDVIVVGRDGRPSGEWIENVVVEKLVAAGMEVRVLGMAPTPTVQLATEKSEAAGGISITASHNPSEWNGLKFLNDQGVFLGPDECERFFAIVDGGESGVREGKGKEVDSGGMLERHSALALGLPFVDVEALRGRSFSVVVDAVNASGSVIVPDLLRACGCRVVALFCEGNGRFPHMPEPVPENLTLLAEAVVEHGADFGVAVDPDADRLVLIDEKGQPIGEEYTITLAADFVLGWERKRNPGGELAVAVNLSTTRAVDDVADRHGAKVVRTAVGEINVVNGMKESGAVIGGEGSGGVILPALHYGRDSLAGIVVTLQCLLEYGGSISELRAEMPSYHIVKKKVRLAEDTDVGELLEGIRREYGGDVTVRMEDGLRLDFSRSWVHLRASNTEPIVRVIAEGETVDEAEELAARFLGCIESGNAR